MNSYTERFIDYMREWQKDNIQLRDKIGYKAFFIRSCVEARRNVPLTDWEDIQPLIDQFDKKCNNNNK